MWEDPDVQEICRLNICRDPHRSHAHTGNVNWVIKWLSGTRPHKNNAQLRRSSITICRNMHKVCNYIIITDNKISFIKVILEKTWFDMMMMIMTDWCWNCCWSPDRQYMSVLLRFSVLPQVDVQTTALPAKLLLPHITGFLQHHQCTNEFARLFCCS